MFEENVRISFRNIRSLGESKQKEISPTLMPSSVKKVNNSAAARANRGQFLMNFRPDKMSNLENESKWDIGGGGRFAHELMFEILMDTDGLLETIVDGIQKNWRHDPLPAELMQAWLE